MEQKSLTTILAEKLGLDPAQNTDTRYQKLDKLLKVISDDDLTRFINKNLPATRAKDKQELLTHFQKYLRTHFTEEILKYYDQSFTNRAAQIDHCKTRISVYKETLQKQQHSDTCYEYFHVILEELSLIEKIISRVKSNNIPETPQTQGTATTRTAVSRHERLQPLVKQTVFGLNFDFIGKLYDNLLIEGFVHESSTQEMFLQHFFVDTVPETRIVLHGRSQSDIGYLIDSLREFFKEDYQDKTLFNTFWAERFEFQTNGDARTPKVKDKNGISRMISEVKVGNRKSAKECIINQIVENLKTVPQ
ncbi:hypothetical protein [Chryseobacterium binzhouense]|uniref:hypothetical protein n=1 Tax=Chryseobacterium binzhouense TaxID=2593646 RepID=UPI00117EA03A|nr:hypothetical protein [Chryseobacterium binzhouense]